jgi:hypothetical protein
MVTVDRRSRYDGDAATIDLDEFLEEELAVLLEERAGPACRAAATLGLPSLAFDVDGRSVTFDVGGGERLEVRSEAETDAAVVVELDQSAFTDLMRDVASTFGLEMMGRAAVRRGNVDDFIGWEPVLRLVLDGRPVYEPGTLRFRDRAGDPLDLHRSFQPDEDADEIGHFLSEAGFLHIQGMFTTDEMRAVSSELDDAIANAAPDDGASWWARTEAGERYPSRILGFNQKSPALRELLHTEHFRALALFTDDEFVQRDPDVGDSAEGLLKKVGVVEGISDVSWHKDCAMGGHSRTCCGLTVGISVTGATSENGELGVVAGSHRANIAPLGVEGVDLPRLPLPTRTGDVTIHCSCTLHMSRPPVSAERRVVYTGFGLAPRPGDHRPTLDAADIRRDRASLNDATRRVQQSGPSARRASFDL